MGREGREGGRGREGREGGREGGRKGGREGEREGGREAGREGGKKGGEKEVEEMCVQIDFLLHCTHLLPSFHSYFTSCSSLLPTHPHLSLLYICMYSVRMYTYIRTSVGEGCLPANSPVTESISDIDSSRSLPPSSEL